MTERTALRRAISRGFSAVGANLRSAPAIAIIAPAGRVEEAAAMLRGGGQQLAAWRMPEIWRARFIAAGLSVPGARDGSIALFGAPASGNL